jgi:hypothetical protein
MGVLNDYVRYLLTLKDSPKAVPMTKKGNIPFGEADLAAIVLASVLMSWQNQYNHNHSTVPELTCMLLPDPEAIEHVMVEKHNEKLKAKGNASTARSEAKSNPKHKASGGPTGRVPKKGRSEKFCQRCKAQGSPYQTHNTLDCRRYDSNDKPLKAAAGKPSESKKPYKMFGGNKAWPSCRPCLRLMQKARRKPVSLRSARSATMTPVTVLTVNRKLGMATWGVDKRLKLNKPLDTINSSTKPHPILSCRYSP